MDIQDFETDMEYVNYLYSQLTNRHNHVVTMDKWYKGDAPVPLTDNASATSTMQKAWANLQKIARINAASLLVDSRLPRISIHSVQSAADSSADGDDEIETFMQESDFRLKLTEALRDTLISGKGYLALTEDGLMHLPPTHTYCDRDAAGNTTAALAMYVSPDRKHKVMLFARPGYYRIAKAELFLPLQQTGEWLCPDMSEFSPQLGKWEWEEPVHVKGETVTIYELSDQSGIIARHLPTLKRINHTILQLGVLVATQAYRKTILSNLPKYDEEGNEIQYSSDMFETAPDALLMLPEGVDIWESSQTDLNPVRNLVLDNLKILAAESKTPLYILSPDSATASAEGASMQNEPLIFDIESLEMRITSTLRRLFADAMAARGDSERADATKINIDWVNPKRPSDVERMSAVQLATSAGVPLTVALRKFGGFSALEVAEVERVQGNQALRDLVVANATASYQQQNQEEETTPGQEDQNPEPDPKNRQVLNNTSPSANIANQNNGGAV